MRRHRLFQPPRIASSRSRIDSHWQIGGSPGFWNLVLIRSFSCLCFGGALIMMQNIASKQHEAAAQCPSKHFPCYFVAGLGCIRMWHPGAESGCPLDGTAHLKFVWLNFIDGCARWRDVGLIPTLHRLHVVCHVLMIAWVLSRGFEWGALRRATTAE